VTEIHEYSDEQWLFLSFIAAIDEPISIEVAGILIPLLPGPLVDLIVRAEACGWLVKVGIDRLCIGRQLLENIDQKLQETLTCEFLSQIIDRIQRENLKDKIEGKAMVRLLVKAGRWKEAGEIEFQMALAAIDKIDYKSARNYLLSCVTRLQNITGDPSTDALFIKATRYLAGLSFATGSSLKFLDVLLQKALNLSNQLGDRRSYVLINLNLGLVFYFMDRRDEALLALSAGAKENESIGDDDLKLQSAILLIPYYFAQGLFNIALKFLEEACHSFETTEGRVLEHCLIPLFTGYICTYLGHFHRAIGSLDYYWRLARQRSDKAMSSTIRALLGMVLVLIKKNQRASSHLQAAFCEAQEVGNDIGSYFCLAAMSLQHYLDGRMAEAYIMLKRTFILGSNVGMVRQFSSPWILEMLYEFHRLGFEPISGFNYPDMLHRAINGINVHLKGTALRLRAKDGISRSVKHIEIMADLEGSKECLQKSGDPVELSKTLLEIARMSLLTGDNKKAQKLAQDARRSLGGYIEEFFPKEYISLLGSQANLSYSNENQKEFLKYFLNLVESLYSSESHTQNLKNVLMSTSRFFGAERSGLFWISPVQSENLELQAAFNLNMEEVASTNFRKSHELICKASETNKTQIETVGIEESALGKKFIRSILCIPFDGNNSRGILYYDNSYFMNDLNSLDSDVIKQIIKVINKILEYCSMNLVNKKRIAILTSEKSLLQERTKKPIIAQCSKMSRVLAQAKQIAGADSSILITGETGTGKELIAMYIHDISPRGQKPFVVVDSTTIPENLVESELFGHERGSFTGADKQKIGRVEIANQGTLFLDEVGELPLQAQSKLLRVFQQKTFNRVGGIKTIRSDFRLIAATNRDLVAEIAGGRFREDLYYRLNVVQIMLPPLRDRGNDLITLAKYFIKQFSEKYKRPVFELSSEDEMAMLSYQWPGNIRELMNFVERAVILSRGDRLEITLPIQQKQCNDDPFSDNPNLDEIQRRYIRYTIERSGGKIGGPGGAAEALGMKRTSLYTRMKLLGMKKKNISMLP